MPRSQSHQRKLRFVLGAVGAVLLITAIAIWVLYQSFPLWFPPWFKPLFASLAGVSGILATLGAILSDFILSFWDILKGDAQPPHILSERQPIRRVDYEVLIARLGRSGTIPWIDRGITAAGLLQHYGRIAIAGWMKSGKTREAAELIRQLLHDGWISLVYEPTATLDLIDPDHLATAIQHELDDRQRYLFFVDELGLRPEPERLNRLALCLNTLLAVRPDTYLLITVQRERLLDVQPWLHQHLEAMIACGIAFHTAALVTIVNRVLELRIDGPLAFLPWILPTLIGVPGAHLAKRRLAASRGKPDPAPAN